MNKLLLASVLSVVMSNVSAQQVECILDEKPHYYVATGTVNGGGVQGLRTFSVVSPTHKDLAACTEGLELLRAQMKIAPKGNISASQNVSYEGFCITTEICP